MIKKKHKMLKTFGVLLGTGIMLIGNAIPTSAAGNSDSWLVYNHAPSTQKLNDTAYVVGHSSGYNLTCSSFDGGGASRKVTFSSSSHTISSSPKELTTTGTVSVYVKLTDNRDVTFNLSLQNSTYGCQASGTVSIK